MVLVEDCQQIPRWEMAFRQSQVEQGGGSAKSPPGHFTFSKPGRRSVHEFDGGKKSTGLENDRLIDYVALHLIDCEDGKARQSGQKPGE